MRKDSTNQVPKGLGPSLGKVILEVRRLKRSTLAGWVTSAVLLLGAYLILIYPVFMAADITNPAVGQFVSSETYRNAMNQVRLSGQFDPSLNGTHEGDGPYSFLITDTTQFGFVVVSVYYRVVRKSDDGQADSVSKRKVTDIPGYTHKAEFSIRPDIPFLILFGLLETMILISIFRFSVVKKSKVELEFEEKALRAHFGLVDTVQDTRTMPPVDTLEQVLRRFHVFAMDLQRRRAGRAAFEIRDEYDVQDLLHALLKMHFADVQREEPSPSFAGGSSRIDFLLRELDLAIEVKMIRESLTARELGQELMTDIARYFEHPKCKRLVFFIYDPQRGIANAAGLQRDLMGEDSRVQVIFSPAE
jgi:hypothetical protein